MGGRKNAVALVVLLLNLFYHHPSWAWIKTPLVTTRRNPCSNGRNFPHNGDYSHRILWSSPQQQLEELLLSLSPPTSTFEEDKNQKNDGLLNLQSNENTPLPPSNQENQDGLPQRSSNGVIPSSFNKSQKVYIPRSSRADGAPNQNNLRSSSSTASSISPRKTYIPSSQSTISNTPSTSNNPVSSGKDVILLTNPQLLIQFKVPREMSLRKRALIEENKARSANRRPQANQGQGAASQRGSREQSKNAESVNPIIPIDLSDDDDEDDEESIRRRREREKIKKQNEDEAAAAEERRKKKALAAKSNPRGATEDIEEVLYDDATVIKLATEDVGDLFDDEQSSYLTNNISKIPLSFFRNLEEDEVSAEEIQGLIFAEYGMTVTLDAIRKKMGDISTEGVKKKKKKKKSSNNWNNRRLQEQRKQMNEGPTIIILPNQEKITISALAELMKMSASEIIKYLMFNEGLMITVNQLINKELAIKLLKAFNKDFKEENANDKKSEVKANLKALIKEETTTGSIFTRSPIVTIMGHVDHGKTTLLDSIRNARVAESEAGGITQAISAFNVQTAGGKNITFIDTPGHAAFSEMRKRGTKITDIVVLVVAADDGVMEQTKECIEAAKSAGCPIVVAINKIDKVGADVNNAKAGLLNAGVVLEELGGDIQCAEISAKQGQGIDELLEKILIQSEVMELKGEIDVPLEATVVEAKIDKGLGVVVTALVQKGIIRSGQIVVAGPSWGKVRFLTDDKGRTLQEAGPSQPVRIVGLNRVPNAGDKLILAKDEETAKDQADAIFKYEKLQTGASTLSGLKGAISSIMTGSFDSRELVKLPVILKADVGGSLEAIKTVLEDITSEDDDAICKIDLVFSGVGDVTTSDVLMATASKAQIIAFNVAATGAAMDEARGENVDLKYYNVLYDIIDDMTDLVKKTLSPPPAGQFTGAAEVKKIFRIGKAGKVAGCAIKEGKVIATGNVRVLRDKKVIFSGLINSLRVVKDSVQEVSEGNECGIQLKDFDELEEGDIIQCFVVEKDSDEESSS